MVQLPAALLWLPDSSTHDLVRAGCVVDWASLCLGLEELILDKDCYCNSGLKNRG